jgi:hypothetical protein
LKLEILVVKRGRIESEPCSGGIATDAFAHFDVDGHGAHVRLLDLAQ